MKLRLLNFTISIILLNGCKSSTEPPMNKLDNSITVTSNGRSSLDGGGRWFNGADTGVWYDVNISYSLNNSSATARNISYKLEFGEFRNGKYSAGNGDLFFDGDSNISGSANTIEGNSTVILNVQPTIGIGRKNVKDWLYPYGYKLTLYDNASADSMIITDSLSGSTAENRFRGIIYTTETSPDPLAVFDGPDDGDWQVNTNPDMGPDACYPNPTFGITTSRFSIQDNDSVVISLRKTKRSLIKTIMSEMKNSGTYELQISMDSLQGGQYRLYYHFVDSMKVFDSYGDIKYVKN